MKPIVSPLRPSDKNDAVNNLQQALSALDFAISNEERIASFFGESTFNSMRRFQESFQIPVTDFVDEQTAKTLNDVLRHKQLLAKEFLVSGHVFDVLGQSLQQVEVVAFDIDLRGIPLLEKVSSISETMQIAGFQWLGSARTDARGFYQIEFDTDSFIHGDKSHADVVAFLNLNDKVIGRSRLSTKNDYVDNKIENLDIQLLAESEFKGLSEYEALLNAINPILNASDLTLTQIVNNVEQINFLAQETDTDPARVLLAAQAESLLLGSTEFSGTDFLYALGRENVGLQFEEITDFSADILFEKTSAAIAKNIIVAKSDESIKDFIKRLLRLTSSTILASQPDASTAVLSFNRAIDISLSEPNLKNTFINIQRHLETNSDPQKFWQEALPQAGFNAEQIQSLQLTNQLHLLTGGHSPLIEALQIKKGITSPAQLMDLTDEDWFNTIKETGLPESNVAATFEEKSQNFIVNIRNVLHAAYPTQKIASMVQKGEIETPELAENLTAFFTNAPDFDFASKRLEDYESIIQAVAPQQAEQVRASLQTLQRVFQISPTPEALSGLVANGITSAFQIAGMPESVFVRTYASKLGGDGVAMSVHSRASHIAARANNTLMTTFEQTHAITPAAINIGNMQVKNAVAEVIKKHIPNYENIFGQADICECRDCRSINSPAAYLVDVLRFLSKLEKNTEAIEPKTPFEVLTHRRPDIAHLPLTCENTNTVIPYIDLVNEVLEYYVTHEQLDEKAAYDTGNSTAQELRASPQNRDIAAYKKLAAAVYPTNLPYHQPLDALRSFLPTTLNRADLMQKFKHTGIEVVAESLNLSPKDYSMLTGENFDATPEGTNLWTFYGFSDDNTFKATIPAVKEILNRTGILYVDLVELLKTRFLNPAQSAFDYIQDLFKDFPLSASLPFDGQMLYTGLRDINADLLDPDADVNFNTALSNRKITSADFIIWVKSHFESLKTLVTLYEAQSECDIAKTSLRTLEQIYDAAPTTLTDGFLSRLHRLIRLWRKTSWTIAELDTVLNALQVTDISPAVLQQLSLIKTIAAKTNLPLDRLSSIWGNIESQGDKSLYQRLFLNRTVSQIDAVFAPDSLGNLLSDASVTIGTHLDAILAAFKIKQEDFDRIAADCGIGASAGLTLANLSVIYRYVAFSKALKLSIADFVLIKSLFAIDPFSAFDIATQQFTAIQPDKTLQFIELVTTIRESGFKAKELNYVFTGNDGYLPTEKVEQALVSIRTAFHKIHAEHPDFVGSTSIDEAFLNAQMALITPSENVNLFFGIINGTSIFATKTQENLAITIPNGLKTKVQYNKAKGILSVTGILTNVEKTALEAGAPPAFIKAIDTVYTMPEAQFIAAFKSYFDNATQATAFVEHNVPLADPAQLAEWKTNKYRAFYQRFLPVLQKTLRENAVIQALTALIGLNDTQTANILNGDPLANLLASARDEGLPLDNVSTPWEGYLSAPIADEFTLIVKVADPEDSFNLLINEELILQKLNGNTQTSWEVAKELTPNRLYKLKLEYIDQANASGITLAWRSAKMTEEIIPSAFLFSEASKATFSGLVNKLHRAAIAIIKYPLTTEAVKHFITHSASLGNLDFLNFTTTDWLTLNHYAELKRLSPEADWLLIFATAYHSALTLDEVIAVAAMQTTWNLADVDYLLNTQFGFTKADMQNPENWLTLAAAYALVQETGISAQRLAAWATPETDFDKLDGLAKDIQNAMRAKYEDKDWAEFAPTINNPLRERRRDGLVSYLLVQDKLQKWGVTDADSLYEYFLIDVQMGACMDTSRVRLAMSSVQLFVTRCQLNLERQMPERENFWVSPKQFSKTLEWEWMKLYRVWEANRKVYIHPENWLEPEWRDDRSPIFKELEAELTQNDISTLAAESAFRHYLQKLQDVSNLDVVGVYDDVETGTLHVVARSHGASSQFYYRNRSNKYGRWSAWENLGLDIKTAGEGEQNGVHVMPIRWKGRLFLFWLEFSEISMADTNGSIPIGKDSINTGNLQAKKAWRIYLAWSEFREGKWLPKKLSTVFIQSPPLADTSKINTLPSLLSPVIKIKDNKLFVFADHRDEWHLYLFTTAFTLTDADAEIKIDRAVYLSDLISNASFKKYLNFKPIYNEKHFMRSGHQGTLLLRKKDYLTVNHKHLLAFDNQLLPSDFEADIPTPFFYQDGERNFFVQPSSGLRIFDHIKNIETVPYLPYLEMATAVKISSSATMQTVKQSELLATTKTASYITSGNNGDIGRVGLMSKTANASAMFTPAEKSIGALAGNVSEKQKDGLQLGSFFNWDTTLKFENFYHPYTDEYLKKLNHGGLNELLAADTALPDDKGDTFKNAYKPAPALVDQKYPSIKVEFEENSAYGLYNWELFFHAPLYIATRLSKNGKYAEAMQWFHYIFNPMSGNPPDANNTQYWEFPEFKIDATENIEEFFIRLANKGATEAETKKISEWREYPFKPHLVARGRPVAYMKNVVMKYVENLIAWGDDLFRRDTMESTNEATQLYVIAAHILGPRPQFIPKRGNIKAETFATLQDKLDAFGNALVQMENLFPHSSSVPVSSTPSNSSLLGVGAALYFCIPNNANLLKYWDTVGDRLFKLRHCMNIDGVERKLALFDPPIDPAVLIAATAKGLSLGSVLSDLFSPSPMYRFNFLLNKALELCAEVRAFGSQLLEILEKKDAAQLALIRSTQATQLLKMVEDVKTWQVIESRNHRETLMKTRETALTQLKHNLMLMAIKSGSEGVDVPPPPQTNTAKPPKKDDELARDIVINGIGAITSGSEDKVVEAAESSLKLIAKEKFDLDVDEIVKDIKLAISAGGAIAKVLSMIPQFDIAAKPFGVGAGTALGGVQLSKAAEIFGSVQDIIATVKGLEGKKAAQTANFVRREQGWVQEAKMSVADVYQIDRQIVIADVRIAMAEKELAVHQLAISHAEEIENFITTQFTNGNLYQFMKERLYAVHKQSYQLAYDMAKTAEKAYRQELGINTSNFIQYGYFDSAMQGLTAGEQLHLALRQMDKAYLDANKREFEITKNVSLAKINFAALSKLKATGITEFDVFEELFDMDYAGHYFRRIKSVSISIPCSADPNTTIAATLRLLKNSIRINTSGGTYERNNEDGIPIDDERFVENLVPFKAVATSHGKNDAGMFELNFKDDRYLPFEGAGVISHWKLEMPALTVLRQFDYNTISDVILHIKYTAREDVGLFKTKTITHLQKYLLNP
ncbi:MAG: hypothetical protein HOP04_15370 [Methylophilaceae bacterium]|nr:hypothetical protein [Methylophilaceae bacterium]